MPKAEPRKMATMKAVREHWNIPYGVCYRCKRNAQVVRGHVIAHAAGGSGEVGNLVPLCSLCNKLCVPWAPGDEAIAWAWMNMDAITYYYEMGKHVVAKEVERWQREREIPGTDESQITLEQLIDIHLQVLVHGANRKAQEWQDEIDGFDVYA